MARLFVFVLVAAFAPLAWPAASADCAGEAGIAQLCDAHALEGDCEAGAGRETSGVWIASSGARAGVYSEETCYRRADGSGHHGYLLYAAVEVEALGLIWWPAHYQYVAAGATECRLGVDSLELPADCERTPREHPGALLA